MLEVIAGLFGWRVDEMLVASHDRMKDFYWNSIILLPRRGGRQKFANGVAVFSLNNAGGFIHLFKKNEIPLHQIHSFFFDKPITVGGHGVGFKILSFLASRGCLIFQPLFVA